MYMRRHCMWWSVLYLNCTPFRSYDLKLCDLRVNLLYAIDLSCQATWLHTYRQYCRWGLKLPCNRRNRNGTRILCSVALVNWSKKSLRRRNRYHIAQNSLKRHQSQLEKCQEWQEKLMLVLEVLQSKVRRRKILLCEKNYRSLRWLD